MSALTAFNFESFNIRVVSRDGEPWFVAADVCAALGIARTDDGVGRLDDDEKGTDSIRTPGGEQRMTVVNESGLYSLILGSRKPEAKRFKKWVTGEVLPSIRRSGVYNIATHGQPAVPQTLPEALRLAADLADQKEAAEKARDEAIRTKALIGSRREATAMASASAAKRDAEKLRGALGFNSRHATIIAVQNATNRVFGPQDWRPLKRWADEHGERVETVPDARYGKANAYPAGAWLAVYAVNLAELFPPPGWQEAA